MIKKAKNIANLECTKWDHGAERESKAFYVNAVTSGSELILVTETIRRCVSRF